MCGINLILNNPGRDGQAAIDKMMHATIHRGPDHSSSLKIAENVYIAGNRLRILELNEQANQPLVTPDGWGILVWNGALYNYQDLRNTLLARQVVFRGRSDSEVLLQWLYVFGEEGLKALQGMYSLIFINKKSESIIVARDLFGKKPLYYFHENNTWIFSSEVRGVLASGLARKSWDQTQYLPYFYLRHTLPDRTFFDDIDQIQPGNVLILGFDGVVKRSFFLEMDMSPHHEPTIETFGGLLLDAVMKHFHADVPVGLVLSGGVDSTLLYQLWFQETGIPLHAYTAVYEDKYQGRFQDYRFAREVAKTFRAKHTEVLLTPAVFQEHWDEYCHALDHPVGDSAGFITWLISKTATSEVKVLISGAGADELLGGYNRHQAFLFYLKHSRSILNAKAILKYFPLGKREYRKFMAALSSVAKETYLNFAGLQPLPADLFQQVSAHFSPEEYPYKAALNWDRQVYLVNDILKIHDNATMAYGIEGRAPYLDWPLVQFVNALPEDQLRAVSNKKWIRELLSAGGFGEIASRKKLGFGLPILDWIRDDKVFRTNMLGTVQRFEKDFGGEFPPEMRTLAKDPSAAVGSSYLQLWNIYLLASWRYKHQV